MTFILSLRLTSNHSNRQTDRTDPPFITNLIYIYIYIMFIIGRILIICNQLQTNNHKT